MDSSYTARVHRVMDHVRHHLDGDLSLPALAAVAHFSPYHFHRIFNGLTGETLAVFTRRARLERAVKLMQGSPQRDLSSIAAEVGFATPSDFSRVFRAQYGCAPSSWDRRSRIPVAAPQQTNPHARAPAAQPADQNPNDPSDAIVTMRRRPAIRLAYMRVSNPWQGQHLADGYDHLTSWLTDRAIGWQHRELVGVSWESGEATPLDRLVYDLGFAVWPDVNGDGEIGIHEFPALIAAEVHCESLPEIAVAWKYLYQVWLPGSPYEPADLPAMKRFRKIPETFTGSVWNVDCSIALRPRRP